MNISITGATGFVGKNLADYLNESNIMTISRSELSSPKTLNLKNGSCLIHLAGKAHDLRKRSHSNEYYEVNFDLTKALFDKFLMSDASKFIFMSSVKAAADNLQTVLVEDYEPRPSTDYGKSKLMAEKYILSQTLPSGKSVYILRPCMIHGAGNKGNLNLLYQFVTRNIPYPLAAFKNKRSFLSVENLCFVIRELILQDIPSGIYNVSDDKPLSTNDVVTILAESVGKKSKLLNIPPSIIKSLAKIGDLFNLALTTERLNKLTENYIVSNSKIIEAIGCQLPLSAIEGLRITAKSFCKK